MGSTETTLIEFCAGYAGISRGLANSIPNLRTVAMCEIESSAIENLIAKMEAGLLDPCPVWNDIRTFPSQQFYGLVDILSAGFPCQPFSGAGLKRGDEDERHLFPFIMNAVERMKPKYVFLENVEGILNATLGSACWNDPIGTPVLLHVLRELERRGYATTWGLFSASESGVEAPHHRKRVFILANARGTGLQRRIQRGPDTQWQDIHRHVGCSGSSGRVWREVVFAADVDETTGECPKCRVSYVDCQCPGPTQDGIEYCDWDGILYGRPQARSQWPARPEEKQYSWEPRRLTANAAEPKMGGSLDGSTYRLDYAKLCSSLDNRVDELRLLGNGVVPNTVTKAWDVLTERFSGIRRKW